MLSVLLIVSEIGIDMSKWRSAKAFCSWLGLCPGNKISGGRASTRAPAKSSTEWPTLYDWPLNRRAVPRPVWASSTASKPTLERPRPRPLTARKLACLIYHLLKYKQPYQKLDPAIYQLLTPNLRSGKLQNQAITLGYKLIPTANVPADALFTFPKFLGRK